MSKPSRGGAHFAIRAALSLALLAGFYVFILVVGVLLLLLPWLGVKFFGTLHVVLVPAALAGPLLIVKSIPRRTEAPTDPGVRFDASTQPELMRVIEEVAQAAGQPAPTHCYLNRECNAVVASGRSLKVQGRILVIGMALLVVQSPEQLRAVLAHEFGHFCAGDTTVSRIVYRARAIMTGAVSDRPAGIAGLASVVATTYYLFFLRKTSEIGRSQELAADRFAADIVGVDAVATSLAVSPAAAEALVEFANADYDPVQAAGYYVSVTEGLRTFVETRRVRNDFRAVGNAHTGADRSSPFDSHPELSVRLAALGYDPRRFPTETDPGAAAVSLVRDLDAVDEALYRTTEQRSRITWSEVPERVTVPAWRKGVTALLLPEYAGMRVGDLPRSRQALSEVGAAVGRAVGRKLIENHRVAIGERLVCEFIGLAAVDAGWMVDAAPGSPTRFRRDEEVVDLIGVYKASLEAGTDDWAAMAAECGLSASVADVCGQAQAGTAATGPSPRVHNRLEYRALVPKRVGSATRELLIDGDELRWRNVTIRACDVISVAHGIVQDPRRWTAYSAVFVTKDATVRFRESGPNGSDRAELIRRAWQAIVRWSEAMVEPEITDRLLQVLREQGEVRVANVALLADQLVTKKAAVPLRSVSFKIVRNEIWFFRIEGNRLRRVSRTSLTKENAVLLPALMAAIVQASPGSGV